MYIYTKNVYDNTHYGRLSVAMFWNVLIYQISTSQNKARKTLFVNMSFLFNVGKRRHFINRLTSRDLSPFLFYVRTFPRSGDYSGTSLEMQFIAFLHHTGTRNTAGRSTFPKVRLVPPLYPVPTYQQTPQNDLLPKLHAHVVLGYNHH